MIGSATLSINAACSDCELVCSWDAQQEPYLNTHVGALFVKAISIKFTNMQAGHECILMCEIDPGARQILKERFPGVPVIPDVAWIPQLPKDTELLVAGFPCIDVSRAGLMQGYEGQVIDLPSLPRPACGWLRLCTNVSWNAACIVSLSRASCTYRVYDEQCRTCTTNRRD